MKKISIYLLLLTLIVSTVIKVLVVKGYNFPFTMDQGRDMVDIRQMVVSHTPRLVGPTTSINGVLLGPFWYYFNLPPFLLGGGDPSYVMIWQILWYQIAVIFLWWTIKKHNFTLAGISAFLLLLSPNGFNTGRYFWNANAMPIMTMFYLGTLILVIDKTTKASLIINGFVAGLAMQFEAAFGVIFFPFSFIYLLISKKKIKDSLFVSLGFIATLLPQALFELRHQFIMTKILINEFTGKGSMLGDKLTFSQRISDRWQQLGEQVRLVSHIPIEYLGIIFIVALLLTLYLVFVRKNKGQNIPNISLAFLVFIGLFYLGFPEKLKGWYVLGISVPLTLLLASSLSYLLASGKKLLAGVVILLLVAHFIYALDAQTEYLITVVKRPSNDPSNLKNQLQDIDWVYREASGSGFKAYNYIPSVYDYSYNYLYWWYGTKKYGYQPSDTAYLPGQPEYIADVPGLWTKKKVTSDKDPIFLLIETDKEMPERQQKWLGNFSKLCVDKDYFFAWNMEAKKLVQCQIKK